MSRVITNDAAKSKNQMMIEIFMAKMRNDMQFIPTAPTMPSLEIRKLRARLMLEECLETISAGLGLCTVVKDVKDETGELTAIARDAGASSVVMPDLENIEFVEHHDGPSLIQIADGCLDQEVVTVGTSSACGIAHQPCFEIGMANNLMKFAPGHKFNEHGKLIKPPNHPTPHRAIADELIRQGADEDALLEELTDIEG